MVTNDTDMSSNEYMIELPESDMMNENVLTGTISYNQYATLKHLLQPTQSGRLWGGCLLSIMIWLEDEILQIYMGF